MNDPTARTLALLSLLQTHRHWSGAELADRLSVSERTVRRDIERLRALGYPVDAEPGVSGGYRLAVGAHVPPLVLTDAEAVALAVGLSTSAVASIDGIEDTTVALMAKVDQMLPDRLRRQVSSLRHSVEVMVWSPVDSSVPSDHLTTISRGCRDHEEIRFEYRRRDGEVSDRLVRPHQLVSAGRRWYLVGFDMRRDAWRTFRVDRMETPRLAGVRFAPLELPADSASEFVTQGMREANSEFRSTLIIEGADDEVAAVHRWTGSRPGRVDDSRHHVELRSDRPAGLAAAISMVSTLVDIVDLDAPAETIALLESASERLRRAVGRAVRSDP